MLEATVLALTAAVLHAGWNLAVKVRADRLAFLGVQFLIGGADRPGRPARAGRRG